MVDSIGAVPLTGGDRSVARISAATPAISVQKTAVQQTAVQQPIVVPEKPVDAKPSATSSISIAKDMAASAPVNEARVAEIKKAIANGTFPILPATIADRLLALKLQWSPDEAA